MTEDEVQLLRTRLSALHRRLRREVPEVAGLSRSAVRVLRALVHGGESGRRPGEVADELAMATSNVAAALRDLEAGGLVVRRRDARDARGVRVVVTDAGWRLVERSRAVRAEWLGGAIAALLDDDEQETLRRASALIERLAGYDDDASGAHASAARDAAPRP